MSAHPPPLRRRFPLLALFCANSISLTGSTLTLVAIPWFVLQTTGSATQTALVSFIEVIAVVIAGALGGTLADRLGYKRISVLADLISGVTIALIPLLYNTVGLAFWQLLTLVFISAFFNAPGTVARTALLPELAVLATQPLERANATLQAIQRGARLLGAPLAGFLIAFLQTSAVLWLDAASFACSALLLLLVPHIGGVREQEKHQGYFKGLMESWQLIRRDRLILTIVITVMMTNFLDAPLLSVIIPFFIKERFNSAIDLGFTIAAFGGGAFVGAALWGIIGPKLPRRPVLLASFGLFGATFWILAAIPPFPLVLLTLVVGGLVSGPINPLITTVVHERVPEQMLGRILGTLTAGAYATIPPGLLFAGLLLDRAGVQVTFLAIALCYLAVTLRLLLNPTLHTIQRPQQEIVRSPKSIDTQIKLEQKEQG